MEEPYIYNRAHIHAIYVILVTTLYIKKVVLFMHYKDQFL